MSSSYGWINDALAWIAPVAAQAGNFTFYKDKLLAFLSGGGAAVAEYEAPEPLPHDEPFAVSYQVAKTIDWSKVTSFKVSKTLELGLYSGKVKLPIIEHIYDPAAIVTEGDSYPALDLMRGVGAVLQVVDRKAFGSWYGNVHVQGDLVCGVPTGSAIVRYAWLAFELPNNAEIPFDTAKILVALPLAANAEVFFDGERAITSTKSVEVNGVMTQLVEEVGVSYAGMSVVSGNGKIWVPLAESKPIDLRAFVGKLGNSKFFVNISPEIAGLFRTINSLAGMDEKPYIIMSFGEDGMTVYSNYVDAVKIPAEFQDNSIPDFSVQVQTRLIEVNSKEWLQVGLSGSLAPVIMQDDDCTIFVQPMGKN
jgi:hypothetical protein